MLPVEDQKYQVKEGKFFINDSRKYNWGKLEALKCERVTVNGHAWNGIGIKTHINHLYFTTDEEIKKDDNIYSKYYGIGKITSNSHANYKGDFPLLAEFLNKPNYFVPYNIDGSYTQNRKKIYLNDCRKIIASTDPKLTLPQPSQAFIEKYCKVGGIDEVDVEYRVHFNNKAWLPEHRVLSLKTDSHNTITIHAIKDSWNREEVIELLYKSLDTTKTSHPKLREVFKEQMDKFIEENL